MSTESVSGYVRTPGGVLSAFATIPSGEGLRGVVVVCPPLFEERKSCAVVFARLAERLADDGFATLRIDPRGTGDSPGELQDVTVDAWCADVAAARAAAGAAGVPTILLGIRFGALLAVATHAAAPADAVVLWEPVASGAEALRQAVQRKLVNDMAAFGATAANRATLDAAWSCGQAVDLDGYRVSAALSTGLRAFAPPAIAVACPALLVATRPGRPTEEAQSRLCPGADVQVHATPPFWSTIGLVDTAAPAAAIAAWLVEHFPQRRSAAAWPPPLESSAGRETQVTFASPRGTPLRAVWHCPDTAPPRLRVLCLAGWSGCRLGPHNVFVTLARWLADEGSACLRLDFGGRGDSAGEPSQTTIASMTEDARAALAWLRAQGPADAPLAVVAICSGGKVAISAAAEEPDLRLLCLWSPEPMGSLRPTNTNRRKTRAMLRSYLLKLLRLETWRKLLTGRVRGGMVGKALLRPETRGADEARREDAVLARFRNYRGRVLCIFGGGDPEAPGSEAAYTAFCARHNIPYEGHTVPQAGHSFYRTEWAEEVVARTRRWLRACR